MELTINEKDRLTVLNAKEAKDVNSLTAAELVELKALRDKQAK